ncbi:MAG TPA: hypothetical protein VLJ60_04395, partial [bacterium]|nr:hypothetical protein [bacterium]
MEKTVQLSELVLSGEFLDGSALYHERSAILLSAEKNGSGFVISGKLKNRDKADVLFSIDGAGRIVSTTCSNGCRGVCRHVVAMGLLFNELSMENADISEQLSMLSRKNVHAKTTFPLKISINKKDVRIIYDPGDYQLKKIEELFCGKSLVLLVSLFPEKFVLGNV